MKWGLGLLALVLIACQQPGSPVAANAGQSRTTSGKIVLGYLDGQTAQSATNANTYHSSLSDLSLSSLYYVTSAGAVVNAGGAITPSTVITQAHTNGLRVYPGISDYGTDGWDAAAAKGAAVTNKSTTVTNIVNYVKNNGFDGAEIDFEYNTPQDAGPTPAQFVSFLQSLATALHSSNAAYKLVVSVPPHDNYVASFFDYAGIAAAVDYMQVMTYDQNGPGWATSGYNNGVAPGPVAGLDWMTGELNYLINTLHIAPAKILSGLPAYGQDYSTGNQVIWTQFASTVAGHSGAATHRGLYGDTVTPWASWGTVTYGADGPTNPVLWYDDATSIQAKAALVNTYGIAGTSVWAVGQENASFWTAVNAGLGGAVSVAVSVSPSSVTVAPSATKQFSATVTGTTNTLVTWSATGGTVTSAGLYTAPATAGTYIVTATSSADSSKTASASVTVSAVSGDTNLAPSGTGYIWTAGSSATSNTTRTAKTAVNDGNVSTSLVLSVAGEQSKFESAGVIWTAAKILTSVKFTNGGDDGFGNGYFQTGFDVQISTNGTTWASAGWSVSPAYPNSSAAYNQTYTFSGAAKSGVLGVRVVGKTGTSSWSGSVKEVQALGH